MARKSKNTQNKKNLFWAGLGAVLLLAFIYFSSSSGLKKDELKLVIDYGNGKSRTFMTRYREGITAWDMLQQANAVYNIPIEIENHFAPKSIDNFKNGESGRRWTFYINGRKSRELPAEVSLSGGEVVIFKFE